MAVTTHAGVTTITPTAWKWYTGAALSLVFVSVAPWVLLISGLFVLIASGKFQSIRLDREGFAFRSLFHTKRYRWDEVTEFRIKKIKSGLFTASTMIAFSKADKADTLYGKFARTFAGGTESMPIMGMKAKKLIELMSAYRAGYVPADTEAPAATAAPKPASYSDQGGMPTQRPAPVRAPQHASSPPMLAASRTTKPAVAAAKFGQKPSRLKAPTKTPLVQDGGARLFGRKPNSPFG